MPDFTVFLDMDGVLADFVGGYCKLTGRDREELEERWLTEHPGEWMLPKVLGCSLEEFWEPINKAGEEFWTGLEPTRHFWDIIDAVEICYSGDWFILSSPSRCHSSHSGKVKWLKNMFGSSFDRFMLTPHKELLAGPDRILIDDSDRNCDLFEAKGGRAYVFPTVGNSQFMNSNYPVSHLPF